MGSNGMNMAQLHQGFNLAGDLVNTFSSIPAAGKTGAGHGVENEQRAQMIELEGRDEAMSQRRQARATAADVRAEKEVARGRENANWGQSGLAASGSRSLVQAGRRIGDRQAEEDVLFDGDQRAKKAEKTALRKANVFRIRNGRSTGRTTLSLGSKLYDPWR